MLTKCKNWHYNNRVLQERAYRFVTFWEGMCDTTTWKAQTTFVTLELVRLNTCTLYKQFGNILTFQAFLKIWAVL